MCIVTGERTAGTLTRLRDQVSLAALLVPGAAGAKLTAERPVTSTDAYSTHDGSARWRRECEDEMTNTARAVAMMGMATLLLAGGVRITAEPSATPRLDWLFNSAVSGTARVGNTLYVGGFFTSVTPRAGQLGRLFALSPSTGAPVQGLPFANGIVLGIAADGAGGYYVTGLFTNLGNPSGPGVGGFPSQQRIAHVLANGQVDAAFHPQIGGQIGRMVRVGPSLVVTGGLFINGGITARTVVALDPVTGALITWEPAVPGVVFGLAASGNVVFLATSDGGGAKRVSAYEAATGSVLWTSVVLGGPTTPVGPIVVAGSRLVVSLERLYAVDLATGTLDASWGSPTPWVGEQIFSLAVSGAALHAAGSFTAFGGQARANLAAVDLATGALLPWAPQASRLVASVSASPNGGVFVAAENPFFGPAPTINGELRTSGVFEIDPAGTVTAWNAQATFTANTLFVPPGGPLVFGSVNVATVGHVSRNALAAFDVTSGALDGVTITFGTTAGAPAVTSLASVDQTLFLSGQFDTVNGQPRANLAAVDATTHSVLSWPATPVPASTVIAIAHGAWIYVYLDTTGPLRRIHAQTGVLDPAFQATRGPSETLALAIGNGRLYIGRYVPGVPSQGPSLIVSVLDPVSDTLQFHVTVPATAGFTSAAGFTVAGDTAYVASSVHGVPNEVGTISAYDLRTGARVSAPAVAGQLNGISAADGRLFAYGGTFSSGATTRIGAAELLRPSGFTAWDTGAWRLNNADSAVDRGVFDVRAHGNLLVTLGLHDSFPSWRVVAHDLSGASVPANLRSSTAGPNTVFSWDAMTSPPAGGYVIEGGFAPGQAAAALPVGNATSIALPLPAGPLFIRVRAQGSSEVSNEIVAGCFAPPLPPTALTTTLNGTTLTLAWTAPTASVTNYTLLAGTAAGLEQRRDVAARRADVGERHGAGRHVLRARHGVQRLRHERAERGSVLHDRRTGSVASGAHELRGERERIDRVAHMDGASGCRHGYVLEAGTGAGLANLGTLAVGATPSLVIPGVPAGTYVLRVRAITSAGSGAPSSGRRGGVAVARRGGREQSGSVRATPR